MLTTEQKQTIEKAAYLLASEKADSRDWITFLDALNLNLHPEEFIHLAAGIQHLLALYTQRNLGDMVGEDNLNPHYVVS